MPMGDALAPTPAPQTAADGLAGTAPVAIDETDRLIASDKVEGTEVFSRSGDRIGSIYNFMVDKVTGQVSYVVMSFGGFLGLGERFYPLPWKILTFDPQRGGYVIDIDREQLERAPSYAAGEDPWSDPERRRNIFGLDGFNYGL